MKILKLLPVIIIIGLLNLSFIYSAFADHPFSESADNINETNINLEPQLTLEMVNDQKIEAISGGPEPLTIDWPMFLFNASHAGYTSSMAPTTNNTLWSSVTSIGGNGYSSPVAANGSIFVNGAGKLYRLYNNNGTEIWQKSIGSAGQQCSVPAVVGDKVYVVGTQLYCFYESNGTEVWKQPLSGGGKGTSSPTVAEGKVFVNTQTLYCFYANNGTSIWSKAVGGSGYGTTPAVADGKIYVNGVNLYCLYTSNGTEIWNAAGGESASPVIAEGRVFINPTQLYCYYANNGSQIWSKAFGGDTFSSPAFANGKVIVNDNSNVFCLYASNGTQVWTRSIAGSGCSTPAIAINSKVLVNGGEYTYCLNETNGGVIWQYMMGGDGWSSPAIAYNRVYVNQKTIYCFGIPDNILPTIQSIYPPQDAMNVSVETNITIVFNDAMNQQSTEGAFSITPNVAGMFNWPDSQTLSFDPDGQLADETEYILKVNTNAKDLSDNPLDGNGNGIADSPSTLDDFGWNFTTRETAPPRVVTTIPKNNDENVSLDSKITVIFNEQMNQTTAEQAFYITPVTAGSFSWLANNLTFQPMSLLLPDTVYSLAINSTAGDLIGNLLDGDKNGVPEGSPLDDYKWVFTTLELTPPQITSVNPADQAQDVLINAELQVNFNEPMNQTAVELAFAISPNVAGIFTSSNGGATLTFSPETTLEEGTKYTVNITSIATDLVGNLMDGNANGLAEGSPVDDYSWSFNTSILPDDIPPQVSNTYPANNDIDINISSKINVTFDEEMNLGMTESGFLIIPSVDGAFSWDLNGQELTFTPTSKLEYDTEYSVLIRGNLARDLAGNTLDGNRNTISDGTPTDDFNWRFTTESEPVVEVNYPKIVAVIPIEDATEVEVRVNIEVTFNKIMDMAATQFAFIITPSVTGAFDWDNNKMTYDPNLDLGYETTYTIQIDTSATDADGNPLDGNDNNVSEGSPFDDYIWAFTTRSDPDKKQYDLDITGVTEININLGGNKNYPITITNIGLSEDVVIPGLEAGALSSYIQISETTSRTLEPTASWAINLELEIPVTAVAGQYNITIEATSQGGGFTIEHPIQVNILSLVEPDEDGSKSTDDEALGSIIIFGMIFIIIIIIVIIIVIVLLLRKRKKTDHGPPPAYPPQPGAGAPPPAQARPLQPAGQEQHQYPQRPPAPMAPPVITGQVAVQPTGQVAWDEDQEE